MQLEIEALKSQDPPEYSATAREFKVDKSTLRRRYLGLTAENRGLQEHSSLLTFQQEKDLVKYINTLTVRGTPPTGAMLRRFACELAHKSPGKNWLSRFISRHLDDLKSSYLTGLDQNRKKADNYYEYKLYFDLVSCLILPLFSANFNSFHPKSSNTTSGLRIRIIWVRRAFY